MSPRTLLLRGLFMLGQETSTLIRALRVRGSIMAPVRVDRDQNLRVRAIRRDHMFYTQQLL